MKKKGNPGCGCCASCSNLPDSLWLRSEPYSRPFGSFTAAWVPFTYDATSGLWACALQSWATGTGASLISLAGPSCSGTGTFSWIVYQMDASFLFTRQYEGCALSAGGQIPENSAPGSNYASFVFGPARGSGNRGTIKTTCQGICDTSVEPFRIFAGNPGWGVKPNPFATENVEVRATPP